MAAAIHELDVNDGGLSMYMISSAGSVLNDIVAISTFITPGYFSARETSIDLIFAWAYFDLTLYT